jgi:hypothetical protein
MIRSTLSTVVAACVSAAVVLSACGSDDGDTADTSTTVTTVPITLPPTTTSEMPTSVDFDLVVGENSGRDTMVEVRSGTTVTLRVVPDGPIDEIHIHGYDLYLEELTVGSTASISFVADVAGSFEVERHDTGEILMILRVR